MRMKENAWHFSGVEWINTSDVFIQWMLSRRENETAPIILCIGMSFTTTILSKASQTQKNTLCASMCVQISKQTKLKTFKIEGTVKDKGSD